MKHYLDTYFAKEMEPAERVAEQTKTKKKQPAKKAKGLRKTLDLARKAEILDKKTATIRQRREKLLENAVKGVTNPKEKLDNECARYTR